MKRKGLVLIFLLLCGLVSAQNERAYQLDKEALELVGEQKYPEAVEKYSQLLELVKDKPAVYYARAYCYGKLYRDKEAMADLETSLRYNPSRNKLFFDTHLLMAYLLYDKGEKEKALMHFATSELEKDNRRNPFALEADSLFKQQRYDEALAMYKQCIDHKIALYLSHYQTALIHYKQAKYEKAGVFFKQAAEYKTDKDWPRALMMLGVCEARLKRYPPSLRALDACIDAGFSEALAYYYRGMGRLRSRASRYDWEALQDFKQVLALNPTSLEGAYGVALLTVVSKQYTAGKTMLDSLIKAHPGSAELYVVLGQAYVGLGEPTEVLNAFSQAKRINPNLMDPHLETAKLYLEQQQPELAMNALAAAKKRAPADKEVVLYEARALGLLGRVEEAQQALKKLMALTYDDFSQYHQSLAGFFLGRLYLEQNQVEAAKEQLEQVFWRLDEAGLFYGDWWLKQGDTENALRIFSSAAHHSDFGSIELQTRVGALYLAKIKYRDAWTCYRDAVKMDPLLAEARLGFGLACVGVKQYPEAMKELTKAIELYNTTGINKPVNRNVYRSIVDVPGINLQQCKLPGLSLQEAHYQRALLYLQLKNREQAKRDLEAAANLGHEAAGKRLAKL